MLKTIIYMIITLLFGLWMIDQLWDSRELRQVKTQIETCTHIINQLIDKLED